MGGVKGLLILGKLHGAYLYHFWVSSRLQLVNDPTTKPILGTLLPYMLRVLEMVPHPAGISHGILWHRLFSEDSDLLVQMAEKGFGVYSFIPDAGFVGTIFVNYISRWASTESRVGCIQEFFNGFHLSLQQVQF